MTVLEKCKIEAAVCKDTFLYVHSVLHSKEKVRLLFAGPHELTVCATVFSYVHSVVLYCSIENR